jgi:hypothetical protein
MDLGIPLPRTPDGRVYRYSPNPEAHPRHFVLGDFDEAFTWSDAQRARMKQDPRSKQTVCPYSGIIEDDAAFTHPDDEKAALAIVQDAATRDVEDELGRIFSGFNQRSSGRGLFSIDMTYTPSKRYRAKPRFMRRDLARELRCDHCSRDYAVYAIGLYCADCGAPNLHLHFAREVELVTKQVELATAQAELSEELAYRLLGNAHEDVLTAFEATLKTVYLHGMLLAGAKAADIKPVKNEFQNVERAQERYTDLDIDPFKILDGKALDVLKLNIQKRHIIGHNLGIIDANRSSLASMRFCWARR